MFVVEYSYSQNAYHAQSLVDAILNNLTRLLNKNTRPNDYNDWVIVSIAETQIEAQKQIDRIIEITETIKQKNYN